MANKVFYFFYIIIACILACLIIKKTLGLIFKQNIIIFWHRTSYKLTYIRNKMIKQQQDDYRLTKINPFCCCIVVVVSRRPLLLHLLIWSITITLQEVVSVQNIKQQNSSTKLKMSQHNQKKYLYSLNEWMNEFFDYNFIYKNEISINFSLTSDKTDKCCYHFKFCIFDDNILSKYAIIIFFCFVNTFYLNYTTIMKRFCFC